MRIVVLDGYTLNPGDLSWDGLDALGFLEVYDRSAPKDTVARAADAEVVLTNKTVLDREVLEQLPKLKYVGVLATGYNVVDVDAARERKIPVTNVPTYGTRSVAQMVFAHLLNLTQRIGHHAHAVREGRWTASIDFCFWDYPLVELNSLVLGIVGFGRTGRATAEIAQAFGMKLLVHDAVEPTDLPNGSEAAELGHLFRHSDVVSLHCPLTPETEKLVNAERLALMKPSAFLINTSRGPVVDEAALADALNAERIAGAGLDVLCQEPPPADHPLLRAKNCYITPHVAWATKAARARLLDTAVENVKAFVDGKPQNVVNPQPRD
ncbi:MAG: D-2-hydroxyacid dehydrogenase [Planctomycetia bacterium]|nr:D-2-hydroxyacid dehydrogenase [Planctomycetia bacterium]